MSFNRLPYDVCSYEYELAQTLGPGIYNLSTPSNSCMPCHADDPYIRLQSQGVSISKKSPLIDIDSELLGLTRNISKCPSRQYLPSDNINQCGAQADATSLCQKNAKLCIDNSELYNFKDCFNKTEDTRLSNPPITLHGTGWNRWEWLWSDPQYNVLVPFDFQINSKIVAKDNHRPCLPNHKNQYTVWPQSTNTPLTTETYLPVSRPPRQEPSISWQSQYNVENY